MSIAELRLSLLQQTPGLTPAVTARAGIERFVEQSLGLARSSGDSLVLRRGRQTRAHLTWGRDTQSWYGVPVLRVLCDVAPDDAEAMRWLVQRLDDELPSLDDTFDLQLSGRLGALLPVFYRHGFGIESAILIGATRTALARLPAELDTRPAAAGLEVRAFEDEAMVEPLIALIEHVFSAEPQFCWFGALPEQRPIRRTELIGDLRGGERLVLLRDGELVGTVAANVSVSPSWGQKAGMDLVFDASIRGMGLATWAYRETLRRAVGRGARVVRGGTSQPAVLALGQRLGRVVDSWMIRKRPDFAREHFGWAGA